MRIVLAALAVPILVAAQAALPRGEHRRIPAVHVVDAAGGGAFLDLPAAIAAATAGDTLLVRSGSYSAFVLDGKALSIVGDAGATVVCGTSSIVRLVPQGQVALLQNLQLRSVPGTGSDHLQGLGLTDNTGAVRIEACVLRSGSLSRTPGLFVRNSVNVLVRDSDLRGGNGQFATPVPEVAGHGADAWNSSVAAYGSTFTGGDGGSGFGLFGGTGGAGWRLVGGGLRVERGAFRGGNGGESTDCSFGIGGSGGPGLRIEPPWTAPVVEARESTFSGGAYGMHACGYTGNPGPPISAGTGSYTTAPGPTRTLAAPSPVRDLSTVAFSMGGVPGEIAYLMVSARDTRETSAVYTGVLFAAPAYLLRVAVGTVPASGTLTYAWPIPDELVPDHLSLVLTAQVLFAAPSGALTLSNPLTLVVVDHRW